LVLDVIPTILVTAVFPRISRGLKENVHGKDVSIIYTVGFKYLFYLVVPIILGTLFVGDKIILLLYGDEFRNAIVVLHILIFSAGFNFFNIFLTGFLYAWNKQKALIYLQTGAIIVSILFNLLLIPKYDHLGAAIASVISHAFAFVIAFLMVHPKLHCLHISDLLKSLVASGVMAVFLHFSRISLIPVVVISAMIYLIVLYMLGGIRLEEILIIRKRGDENVEK
jgi:O-antigen/teichoic acid export membrane protein